MSTEELEKLIKKLLAQGITVIVLTLGPAGEITGTTPDAAPPAGTGTTQVEPPGARDRPPLELDDRPGTGESGTGDSGTGDSGTGDSGTGGTGDNGPGATGSDGTATGGPGADREPGADGGDAKGGGPDDGNGPGNAGTGSDGDRGGDRGGGTGPSTGGPGTGDTATGGPGTGGATGTAPSGNGTTGDSTVSGAGATAAETHRWGRPVRTDDFTNGTSGWSIYDGAGHAGNGRRTPEAVSVADGMLTITGDSEGNTAGMAWTEGSQKYGRWEGRVRAPASDPSYNALLLLWPTAENFPEGGEIDFMEMMDPSRQTTNMFLHYGADNSQIDGEVEVDGTQWHNWAVEWTPERIAAFVDGKQWFETTDTSIFPPGPMHLCIQLDWFPKGGSVRESQMQVDWVRQYAVG